MLVNRRIFLKTTAATLLAPAAALAQQSRPIARLEDIKKALEAKGYSVQIRNAFRPWEVQGRPAVTYIIGDMHTEAGNAFTLQAIADLKPLTGVDTILAEGRSFDPARQTQAVAQLAAFNARAQARMMSQVELDKRFSIQPNLGEYSYFAYEDRAGIPKVRGLEDDHYWTTVMAEAANVFFELSRAVETQGQLIVTCDGQFIQLSPAKMFEAFAELRRRYGPAAPTLDVSHIPTQAARTSSGLAMKLGILTPDVPELQEAARRLNTLFPKEAILARSAAAARNTVQAFKLTEASSSVLAIFGRSHLRTQETGGVGPTYLDLLEGQGVTTLTIMPGPTQPSFEG